jgi:hypothetical protein
VWSTLLHKITACYQSAKFKSRRQSLSQPTTGFDPTSESG